MDERVTESGSPLRGKLPGGGGGAPKRAVQGRTCARRDCPTVLSVYNAGNHCWQHTPTAPYFLHVGRIRPTG